MNPDRTSTITNSQLREGYKQTEVGIIPEDWDVKSFFEVLRIANGQVSPKNEPFRSMILVAPDHVETCTGRLIGYATAAEQGAISGKYLVSPGDIVYSKIRPYLRKAILADFDGLCSADMYPLTPAQGNSPGFLFAVILGDFFSRYTETVSARSGIPKVNREDLSQCKIALPSTKVEQEAIACTLSDIDTLIESLDRLLTKKRQIKQGAMQELLRSKEGRIEKRLGDLANILRGASPRPIDSPIWFDENSEIGWVRISDITKSGIFLYETTQRLSPLGLKSSRFVARNNLIMSICATVGRPIITAIDTCIHDGFVVFEALQADMRFIFYALQSIENDWGKHGQTGSQMNLNTNLINSTKIFIPESREKQIEIANILSDMDAEIDAISAKLTKTRQLKQGMMHELLTGRIRLVDTKLRSHSVEILNHAR
jgi:type I restriction enzyme, S subunit